MCLPPVALINIATRMGVTAFPRRAPQCHYWHIFLLKQQAPWCRHCTLISSLAPVLWSEIEKKK